MEEFLQHLSRILAVLLDPSKSVIDDTSLQRLLDHCKDAFSKGDIIQCEDGLQTIFTFLEACCAADSDVREPSTLTFALRLVSCMSSNEKLLNRLITRPGGPVAFPDIKQGLLLRLLWTASHRGFTKDPAVQGAWFELLHATAESKLFLSMCCYTDALTTALNLMEDKSMYVVAAAQRFLAKVFIMQYRRYLETNHSKPFLLGVAGVRDAGKEVVSPDVDGETPLSPVERVGGEESAGGSSRVCSPGRPSTSRHPLCDGGGGDGKRELDLEVDDGEAEVGHKKARLSPPNAGCGNDEETWKTCKELMASIKVASALARLLRDMEICQSQEAPSAIAGSCGRQDERVLSCIGVFRRLLEDQEGAVRWSGLSFMDDVAMVTRCGRILSEAGQCSEKVANGLVELLHLYLSLKSQRCASSEGQSLLPTVQSLPTVLLQRGFVRQSVQLARSGFTFCTTLRHRFQVDTVSAARGMLAIILGPLCLIVQHSHVDDELLPVKRHLESLQKGMGDGKTALPSICASLSTLGRLVEKDSSSLEEALPQVLHAAVGLLQAVACESDENGQSQAPLHQYRSVIGSRRVIISTLGFVLAAISRAAPSKADTSSLLATLLMMLKNPNTEYQITVNVLKALPGILSVALGRPAGHEPHLMPEDALYAELGQVIQKMMGNIEWEIRDSTIICVKSLLQKKSGPLTGWMMTNHLHQRLWESLADGESYVRSSSLQALSALPGCDELWQDVLATAAITQEDVVAEVVGIIETDSEAFARRAALDCLTSWLLNEKWMQRGIDTRLRGGRESPSKTTAAKSSTADIDGEVQDSSSSNADLPDGSKERAPEQGYPDLRSDGRLRALGDIVLHAVSVAMCDLDWEMKLGALRFWELLFRRYIPGFNLPDATYPDMGEASPKGDAFAMRITPTEDRDTVSATDSDAAESSARPHRRTEMAEERWQGILSEVDCLKMLMRASGDEDLSVSCRACLVLQHLKGAWQGKQVEDGSRYNKGEDLDNYSVKDTSGTLQTTCDESVVSSTMPPSDAPLVKESSDTNETQGLQGSTSVAEIRASDAGDVDTPSLKPSIVLSGANASTGDQEECGDNELGFSALIGRLLSSDWSDLLRHREAETVEGPVSLMMDIIAAAEQKDENLLDCY